MKVTKILALILALAMSLTLAACGDEATPSSNTPNNDLPANSQGTNAENPDNGAETLSENQTQGNADSIPQGQELVSELKVGIGGKHEQGQEIAMRITIPELPERLAALELNPGTFSDIGIHFGNGFYKPLSIYGAAVRYTHNNGYDPIKIDGDSVLLIFFMPEQYSADDIGDVEVRGFTISGLEQDRQTYIKFSNNDVIVPFDELVPHTKLSEFVFDPTAITLSATNNGDGTMSFVYKDTSIKPTYIMPWEWIERDPATIFFAYWTITGIYNFSGDACIGGLFAIGTDRGGSVSTGLRIGYGDLGYDVWDYMTLDLEKDIVIRNPEDMQISIDETGLTAVWTEQFKPGFGFDDIIEFWVVADFNMHGLSLHDPDDNTFIRIYEGLTFEVADVVE
ncbi:MAG: hypothetical protein FWG70_03435 [Oscillospiraceae bacterium]|nr:hypothetical protein [Oscillospiraceae bacterium]